MVDEYVLDRNEWPSGFDSPEYWRNGKVLPGMDENSASLDLAEVVLRLAEAARVADVDVADGHARWGLYRSLLTEGKCRLELQQAVALESDAAIARSLVFLAMDVEPADTWIRWADCLQDSSGRDAAIRRLSERAVLSALADPVGQNVVEAWSDWLQARLAAGPALPEVQSALAVHGRTKRVRDSAVQSLRNRADGLSSNE